MLWLARMRVSEVTPLMKEIVDSMPASEVDKENFANRKLIRPTLPRAENHGNHGPIPAQMQDRRDRPERHDRPERGDRSERSDRGDRASSSPGGRKVPPPEQTNAENFYYQKQMQSRTPMVIVLRDGEEVHGYIEWYDKTCLKVNRENGEPNLMIYKPAIKYMYKEGENQS
jgi:host factor-I protein